ncbi:hypothetical protein F5890DRAFT_175902 [Lentinula detonsa]|uniref:Uncharacterized protein n=1 Tax=Lentinula detonsa TaxID=2804962 RepID=A0AA38Q7H0_9AGAR|nr:hypothetical protein F5890DRAFT_175902 [Lentinula detonsa]
MSSRKRKHVSRNKVFPNRMPEGDNTTTDSALYVQAYEADIIRGPRGHVAALSLEVRNVEGERDVGSGLIRLGGDDISPNSLNDEWDDYTSKGPSLSNHEAVWVDRRHLILPFILQNFRFDLSGESTVRQVDIAPSSSSPTGWSDLPSDAEDTFFLTADEIEDYRREKRRRLMERTRDERLKARMEEDGDEEEIWGGSDEEPEESQREIMRRTAKSIIASPNPAQLELRILANHGADARFAFLRGRWSRAWNTVKAHARVDKLEQEQKATHFVRMGLVADYSDSDEGGEDDEAHTEETGKRQDREMASTKSDDGTEVGAIQALRRARAKEWMASRKSNVMK